MNPVHSHAPASLQTPRLGTRFAAVAAGLLGLAALASAAPAHAALSGNLGLRDVSRLIESDGRFYIYGTGGGGKSTADGLVFDNLSMSPPWNLSYQPGNQRIWAPDVIYVDGRYLLYGSMWSETNPKKASVIVLLSSPSLDPAKAKWKDEGVVISGPSGVTHSVIDPSPIIDPEGNLWVVWGGGYPFPNEANSIFLTRIDRATGLPLTTDPGWKPPDQPGYPLAQGHKEGPAIVHHGDYFYLFHQTGSCCSTDNGGYVMHVQRSSKITGPYTGDRVFYNASTKPGVTGPGHMGVYNNCGVERFTYHYISDSGSTIIGSNEFVWGADGWPTVGNVVTAPLKACGVNASVNGGPGGTGGAGGTTGAGGMGGVAAGSSAGGMAGTGGANSGGTTGTAGETGSAGTSTAPMGGTPPATAGSTSTPGTSGTATSQGGSSEGTSTIPDDEAGCACDIGKTDQKPRGAAWLLGATLAAIGLRRRRA